ncbi:MAG: class I SAM-dependent methyltransferase [Pseudomonadota bacterium]|nr:class I SAM-dependent methyltransferase [Pseudomonadota bacterium]
MEKPNNPITEVKAHYERYPYPLRDPASERQRLFEITLDKLELINFYGFKGRQNFDNHFRVLVAGGGTGDSTLYLAEQLRDKHAEIIYVDLSTASMHIAQERAKVRKLNNIQWYQCSLLELPQRHLGQFDYINCGGVLHYLDEQYNQALLATLKSLLKPEGCMGIMVYGQYGRTGVYQMQKLMQLINAKETEMPAKVENTQAVLQELPATNWFKRAEELFAVDIQFGDIGLYDLFLHSQDRAYTVLELHDLLEHCGLYFVDYVSQRRILYNPATFIKNQKILTLIQQYDQKQQQAIAELIGGNIQKHLFYAANQPNTIARLDDLDNVPFLSSTIQVNIADLIGKQPGQVVTLFQPNGINVEFQPRHYTQAIFSHLDGHNSLKEIFAQVRHDFQDDTLLDHTLLEDFRPIYQAFNYLDLMLLRHKTISRFKTTTELQENAFKKAPIRIKKKS